MGAPRWRITFLPSLGPSAGGSDTSQVPNGKRMRTAFTSTQPDHLTSLLRNLYGDQEATVRTGHGTDWFQIGKGIHQGCIPFPI